jgi:hypothetical protein
MDVVGEESTAAKDIEVERGIEEGDGESVTVEETR